MLTLSDPTYHRIADLMYRTIGVSFNDSKKALVSSRLANRIQRLGMDRYEDYLALISSEHDEGEFQVAVDLLTTNETYFFREPRHFEFLESELSRWPRRPLAVWSAASSFGDEAYSVAMLLSEMQAQGRIGTDWRILGTDISERVLRSACEAIYPAERLRKVSQQRLKRHCLKGEDDDDGLVQMADHIRERVQFGQLNLCEPIEDLGPFDVIFLRNVLIYFDPPTKRQVVDRVLAQLREGGLFFTGTAEGKITCNTPLQHLEPGVSRKLPAEGR
jgi:chemotaxis protein methyltransferase CheR